MTSGQVKTSNFQPVLPCLLRMVGFGLNFPLSLTPGRGRRVTVGAEDWQEGGSARPTPRPPKSSLRSRVSPVLPQVGVNCAQCRRWLPLHGMRTETPQASETSSHWQGCEERWRMVWPVVQAVSADGREESRWRNTMQTRCSLMRSPWEGLSGGSSSEN